MRRFARWTVRAICAPNGGWGPRTRARAVVGACVLVVAPTACLSACSSGVASTSARYVTTVAPHARVELVPELEAGWAGWCMSVATTGARGGSGGCDTPQPSAGSLVAETCEGNAGSVDVYVIVRPGVSKVSIAGGRRVATHVGATLPDGLRAAAVELVRRHGHSTLSRCPPVEAWNAHGEQIDSRTVRNEPLAVEMAGSRHWRRPSRPEGGVCRLTTTALPEHASVEWGGVAMQMRPVRGVLGRALVSCVDAAYVYRNEHVLTAALLLNAKRPGAPPPPIPGMKELRGRRGIFVAPGVGYSQRVMRRVRGGWLVVQESDGNGLAIAMGLLMHLRATIHLGGVPVSG